MKLFPLICLAFTVIAIATVNFAKDAHIKTLRRQNAELQQIAQDAVAIIHRMQKEQLQDTRDANATMDTLKNLLSKSHDALSESKDIIEALTAALREQTSQQTNLFLRFQ